MKPYYDDGKGIVIYHGDCREILPALPKVDLVLTDPPYGTGKLEMKGGHLVSPTKRKFDWDVWTDDWIDIIGASVTAVFTPPKQLSQMLSRKGARLLAAVSKQGVCVKNISPRYGIQAIVLLGKPPINYSSDWIEYTQDGQRKNHPTEKPLTVMRWLVLLASDEPDTILDPFMGSGTTLRAAKDLGRKAIGIEIEERYCEIAARRLAQEVFEFA